MDTQNKKIKKKNIFSYPVIQRVIAIVLISALGLLTWLLSWGHGEICEFPNKYSTKVEVTQKFNVMEGRFDKLSDTFIEEMRFQRQDFKETIVLMHNDLKERINDIKE